MIVFCFIYSVNLYSIFNMLKRVTDGSFLFLCKMLFFVFLPFLNLGTKIRCPQDRHTNVKSALDQPLVQVWVQVWNYIKKIMLKNVMQYTIKKNKKKKKNETNTMSLSTNCLFRIIGKIKREKLWPRHKKSTQKMCLGQIILNALFSL